MVNQITSGLEEEVEGFVDEDEIEDVDTQPQEEDGDPIADVREELATIKQALAKFSDFDPQAVKRELGHVRSLQSRVDSLTKADPLETINPRVATNEELLGSVVEMLVNSDYIEDTAKASLRSSLAKLANAKTEQEWTRRERELLSKVQSTTEETQTPETDELSRYVEAKTTELRGYARAKSVDFASLPAAELQFKPGETVDQAFDRVIGLIDEQANEGSASERLAGRRKAAGGGSPKVAAGSQSDMDKYLSWGRGEIKLTDKELRQIEAKLQEQGEI